MRRMAPSLIVAVLATGLLSGCKAGGDPFPRAGTWRVEPDGGAVMHNLRAEIANPADLVHGETPPTPDRYGGVFADYAAKNMNKSIPPAGKAGAQSGPGGAGGGQSGGM